MPNPDDKLECPHCQTVLRHRDLLTTTVEQCRACKGTIRASEWSSFRNYEAIFQMDFFAIDAWLSQVGDQVERVPDHEMMGEFIWSIAGPSIPCRCQVVYKKSVPDFATVVLCVDVPDLESIPDQGKWRSACEVNCVQAAGMTGTSAWWGAAQAVILKTHLSPLLFRSIVGRLAQAIEAATSQAS